MSKSTQIILTPEFVDAVPSKIEQDKLYISMQFATAVHSCCCGCGLEVITPLSPTDWKLIFDGVSVSLSPSIGNWSFPCQSHYWIRNNTVEWAAQWSEAEIDEVRKNDRLIKNYQFDKATIDNVGSNNGESFWSRWFGWRK